MWGNLVLDSYMHKNLTTSFQISKSDTILHLMQWQYWWWFWFSLFFIFYYFITIKVVFFRSLKFYPKLSTSMRPRGRWGDLIIAIIPIYWCSNILINSNALLKVIEWQDMSSFLTVRVRGKQWYWVYKLGGDSNLSLQGNIGMIGNDSFFSLKNVFGGFYGAISNGFWSSWSESFYFNKTGGNINQNELYFCTGSEFSYKDYFVFSDNSLDAASNCSDYFTASDINNMRLETFSIGECIYNNCCGLKILSSLDTRLLGDTELLWCDDDFNYSYHYSSYIIVDNSIRLKLNDSGSFNSYGTVGCFKDSLGAASFSWGSEYWSYFSDMWEFSYVPDSCTEDYPDLCHDCSCVLSYPRSTSLYSEFDQQISFIDLSDVSPFDSFYHPLLVCLLDDFNIWPDSGTAENYCSFFYNDFSTHPLDSKSSHCFDFSSLGNFLYKLGANQTNCFDLFSDLCYTANYSVFLNPNLSSSSISYYGGTVVNGLYPTNSTFCFSSGNFFDYIGVGDTCMDSLYGINIPQYLDLYFIAGFRNFSYLYDGHINSFLDYFRSSLFYGCSNCDLSFSGVLPDYSIDWTDFSICEVPVYSTFPDLYNIDCFFSTPEISYFCPELTTECDYQLYLYYWRNNYLGYGCDHCCGKHNGYHYNTISGDIAKQGLSEVIPCICSVYENTKYGGLNFMFCNPENSLYEVVGDCSSFERVSKMLLYDFIYVGCDGICSNNSQFSCIYCFFFNRGYSFSYSDPINTVSPRLSSDGYVYSALGGIDSTALPHYHSYNYYCGDLNRSVFFDYYYGGTLLRTIDNWLAPIHITPFVAYNMDNGTNSLNVFDVFYYFENTGIVFDYNTTSQPYKDYSDYLYIPFGDDYKYTTVSCTPVNGDYWFTKNHNILKPFSTSIGLSAFSEIGLFRSSDYKNIVDILFLDRDSLHKKPRYFLTMRQKPLKSWYSYSRSGGFIGNTSLYNNGISGSLEMSNYPYSDGYSLSNSNRLLNTTTILVLPVNKHISIISNSFDVVHSWFIPGLGIKIDCVPGRSTHHTLYIDSPGFYYGQCAEICGRFHHHMPIKICALVFEHFLLWWNHYFIYLNESDNWSDSLAISRQKYSGLL